MKIEFLPPEEAAQRIHEILLDGRERRFAPEFAKEGLRLCVGHSTLFRWVATPGKYGKSLQLFWWGFCEAEEVLPPEEASRFVKEMGAAKFRSLVSRVITLDPEKVRRWTLRTPKEKQWELQAAVALAMALQKEAGGC